jgi:hypothetical protein
MCDYCDCRDLTPIRELSEEHDRVVALSDRLRAEVGSGGEPAVTFAALQTVLAAHLEREEVGIFAQLAGRPGFETYLDRLSADHNRVRAGILAVEGWDPGRAEGVLAALDELAVHIGVEEYDLFPASRMIIDDAGWAQVMAAHARPAEVTKTDTAVVSREEKH